MSSSVRRQRGITNEVFKSIYRGYLEMNNEKVPCKRCGRLILPSTAASNNGYCRNPECNVEQSHNSGNLENIGQLMETCSVCGKTLESIGADIRAKQQRGLTVITHDLIAFCPSCGESFCSDHYDRNDMAGTHTCRKCGSKLGVFRTGYLR